MSRPPNEAIRRDKTYEHIREGNSATGALVRVVLSQSKEEQLVVQMVEDLEQVLPEVEQPEVWVLYIEDKRER